jgi:hypothetical protein
LARESVTRVWGIDSVGDWLDQRSLYDCLLDSYLEYSHLELPRQRLRNCKATLDREREIVSRDRHSGGSERVGRLWLGRKVQLS